MKGAVGNPTPFLAGPPPPGSVSNNNSSLGYDIAKNMGITIVTTVTGSITFFLLNKLWKHVKAKLNTPDAISPPNSPSEHYTTAPSSPSNLVPV
jgi:hypothetical protein